MRYPKQGPDMVRRDIAHLERISWRIERDVKRPEKEKNALLDHLKACIHILHDGKRDKKAKL
jgi:hypothetical protein